MTISCKTVSDLQYIAAKLISAFPGARVFAFFGSMGSGKTSLIKSLCRELGVVDIVQSPSFTIINEYKTLKGESVFHFDFYRIKKLEEVFDIGYEEYLYSGSYCFIEWPEHMEKLLPEEVIKVRIAIDPTDKKRIIKY